MRKLHKRAYPGNGIFLHAAAGFLPLIVDLTPIREEVTPRTRADKILLAFRRWPERCNRFR